MINLDAKMDLREFNGVMRNLKDTLSTEAKSELEMKLAEDFLKFFKTALKNNQLGLQKLSPFTIAKKRREGMSKPTVPMYGEGDNADRSYINLITIHKTKQGTRVGPIGNKKHHSGMTIKKFAIIHASGSEEAHLPARNPVEEAKKNFSNQRVRNTVRLFQGKFRDMIKRKVR